MDTQFKESQKFRQPWVWLVLLVCLGLVLSPVITGVVVNIGIILSLVLVGLAILLFASMRLSLKIDEAGVEYRFFPFQWKYKRYAWTELKNYYVRQYNPIWEYGGWGVRFNRFGRAYTVRGKYGLHLEFPNGKHLLIGTQKPKELEHVIARTKQKDPAMP